MADVIDQKTDDRDFGVWPVREHTSVTLKLLETAPGEFGVNYDAAYSGVKSGQVAGGPVAVSGNGSWVVNPSPKVTVVVSSWSNDTAAKMISAHFAITVDAPVIGTITVFDKDMGGKYGINQLAAFVAHIADISKPS